MSNSQVKAATLEADWPHTHFLDEVFAHDGSTGDGEPVWVSVDPTNGGLGDEMHVKIGHGRFHADVLPVKGIYGGTASSALSATVTMSRIDATAGASS